MSYMRISDYLQALRDAFAWSGVDYKEVILGKSAEERDIVSFLLPKMEVSSVIVGFPHPNEPLSQLMTMQIVRKARQFQNKGEKNWVLIPVWDIDGAIRNQDWFLHADNIAEMVKGWYRPAANRQVEWDFPLAVDGYRHITTLPETQIVKNLLDKVHPQRLISLHNGIVGNAYCYMSQDLNDKANNLSNALRISGFNVAEEPPVPYSKAFDVGIFELPYAAKQIDWLKKTTGSIPEDIGGAASFEYAKDYSSSVVSELPAFRINNSLHLNRSRMIDNIEELWSTFICDLNKVFVGSSDLGSNVYLSSPYEYYLLQDSDFSFLQDEIKRQRHTSEEAFNSFYLSHICIMAFQYSQMIKSSLHMEFANFKLLLSELAHLNPYISVVKSISLEQFTEELMESLL